MTESTGKCSYGPSLETRSHLPPFRKNVQPQADKPPFCAIAPQGKQPNVMHMGKMLPFWPISKDVPKNICPGKPLPQEKSSGMVPCWTLRQARLRKPALARGWMLLPPTFLLTVCNSGIQLYHFKIPKSCALSPVHISSPVPIDISKPLTRERTTAALQDLLSRCRSKALPHRYPRAALTQGLPCQSGKNHQGGWMGPVHLSVARKLKLKVASG